MVVKNFAFKQGWNDRKVAGIEKTFFGHFWSNPDPHFGPKRP